MDPLLRHQMPLIMCLCLQLRHLPNQLQLKQYMLFYLPVPAPHGPPLVSTFSLVTWPCLQPQTGYLPTFGRASTQLGLLQGRPGYTSTSSQTWTGLSTQSKPRTEDYQHSQAPRWHATSTFHGPTSMHSTGYLLHQPMQYFAYLRELQRAARW